MVTKTVLRQYSRGERVVLSGLFLAVAVCLAWLSFNLLQSTWQRYALDQRFERDGVKTQGFVSEFRYVTYSGRYAYLSTGYYPVVTIETPKGQMLIPTSYEHPLNKAQQDQLLWQKVDALSLRDEHSTGRVPKWHGSAFSVLTFLGVVLLIAALFICYAISRLSQLPLRRHR